MVRTEMFHQERYCCTDVTTFAAGGLLQLIYNKNDRTSHLLSGETATLLASCRSFLTLEQHAQTFLHSHPSLAPDETNMSLLRDELTHLVAAKLLISESELIRSIEQHKSDTVSFGQSIATVGIVTQNRFEGLHRCLRGYLNHRENHGRSYDLAVMDDSEDADARERMRQSLRAASASSRVPLAYAGFEEKRCFADALVAASGVPPEVVEFALFDSENCGNSLGANRNALLLQTAGSVAFSADDDTEYAAIAGSGTGEPLDFNADWDLMDFTFFANREESQRYAVSCDVDLFDVHEQMLGKTLRECVSTFYPSPGLRFESVAARPLRDIAEERGAVVATFGGVLGDSGMDSPRSYLLLGAESRERLVASEHAYASAFSSREILRVVKRPVIGAHSWCVTTAYGFDNKRLLPPFMPIGRGEDDVWGLTIQASFDDPYFGYLPWALRHIPPENRSYSSAWMGEAAPLRIYQVMMACISSFHLWPKTMTDESQRLQALGSHLIALGSLSQPDFEEFVRLHVWRMQSEYISFLENQLHKYKQAPVYWAQDVKNCIAEIRSALAHDDYIAPRDLMQIRPAAQAKTLMRRLVLKFGQLLYWWPQIVKSSISIREESGSNVAITLP